MTSCLSIARYAPRGTPAGYHQFKLLAPGAWFNSVTPARYVDLYAAEVLKPLDPKTVRQQLLDLAAGAEPTLLCWERPTDTGKDAWCHRRLVADWLEQGLGEAVPELGYESSDVQPLFPSIGGAGPAATTSRQGALFR